MDAFGGPISIEFTIPDSRETRETWAILYGYYGPMHENGEYYSHHLLEEYNEAQDDPRPDLPDEHA